MKLELDLMDAKFLNILQSNTRVTMAKVSQRIHPSQPALTERRAIKPVN